MSILAPFAEFIYLLLLWYSSCSLYNHMIVLILVLAAFILFVLAAINTPSRPNLTAAGLACLTLAGLVHFWSILT